MSFQNDTLFLLERALGPMDFRDSQTRELIAVLEQKDAENETLRESRANLAIILEELKEQIQILTDERDDLIESLRRIQGEFFQYPPNTKRVFDIEHALSPTAKTVFGAIVKRVDGSHTFASLRRDTLQNDYELLEAVMELYRGELVDISDDREQLEAIHISAHGRDCLLQSFEGKHSQSLDAALGIQGR